MLTPATTATRLGVLATRGLKLQVAFLRGAAACQYSSLASRQSTIRSAKSVPSIVTRLIARKPACNQSCQVFARGYASTTASGASGSSTQPLDWNTFFTLRKTRRRFQIVSGILTMAIGGTVGAILLLNMDLDWLLTKVPMDPFLALGIVTLSFAGLGWLAGPSVGSALFYTFKKGVRKPMELKESEFFSRIKKNRVDPSNSSLSGNAVPDFYGEKISSVAGYRQWLKDQRAFNKKRTSFV
ncbi:Pam17-domain-containing protein [Daldinia caldariorum]|uniref:Pam17-domain-containing protein n=1 Tax=Daldinia caldariorum TaxID=326644 RepID=UPI002008D9FF|nr:Pam17-domain-containing protein [Daldinia caldariorum]KAI1465646.1 Pam17-domain-containing protein [Daldinia caldariorum]